jgi:hypothetical protein
MGMSDDFEKWADSHGVGWTMRIAAEMGWKARQPEIDALKKLHDIDVFALTTELTKLQAEVSRLRADAERYRWLRDPCVDIRPIIKYQRGDYGWGLWTHKALDEAIDAAMKDFSTTTKEEQR